MPVSIADVLAPFGRIEPPLFPGEGDGQSGSALYSRLVGYLTDATERTAGMASPDAAVKEWIYYRAFDAAALRMAALPSEIDQANEGGHRFAADQRVALRQEADRALSAFQTLLREDAAGELVPSVAPTTRPVRVCYDW